MQFEQGTDVARSTACLPILRERSIADGADVNWDVERSIASGGTRLPGASPLRVMFVQTDMRVGGAEMITANVIRRLDRHRFAPELCCLKSLGTLGEALAKEIPVHHDLLASKYDLRVWPR